MSSLGNFASLQAVWEVYPEGANKGDYVFIPDADGVRYNWDKHKRNWIAEGQPSSGTRFTEHVPGNIEVDFDAKINGSLEVSNFEGGNVAEKAILSSVEERVTTEEGKTATLQEDVAVLQEKTIRNKGIFATSADLPNANLVNGDFAYVGTDLTALELYNYTTSWVGSGTTFNISSLDLVDNVTGDAVDKAPNQKTVKEAFAAQSFAAVVLTNPFTAGKSPRRIGDFAINTASGEIWQAIATTNAAASWNCISAGYYNGRIITNWDTHTQSGDMTSYGTATGAPTSTESFYGHHINSNAGTANAVQWAIGYTTNKIYMRTKTASTWGAWSTGITAVELGHLSGVTSNIQSQIDGIETNIAPEWVANTSYTWYDFVMHNNLLYMCISTHSDSTWNEGHWLVKDVGKALTSNYNNNSDLEAHLSDTAVALDTTVDNFAAPWRSNSSYVIGELVIREYELYRCKTANNDSVWTPSKWTQISIWQYIDCEIIFESTEVKESILPKVLNKWGKIESLTINSFQGAQEGYVNEYMLEFTVSEDDFTLTLPEGVRWIEEPTWENGYTYQVSIVNNLAVFAGWEA